MGKGREQSLVALIMMSVLTLAGNASAAPQPTGAPFQVNTTTSDAQTSPRLEARGDRFLVVWENAGASGGTRVSGQRLNLDGSAMGGEFTVPSSDAYPQLSPRLALTDTGDFLVQWQSEADVGGTLRPAVRARAFNADTTPAEPAFLVATEGGMSPAILSHEVASTPSGTFVVAISRVHYDYSGYTYASVHKLLRTADGTDIGNTNLTGTFRETMPTRLEGRQGGAFVVALTHTEYYAGNQYFRLHRFDEDGLPDGAPFTVFENDQQFLAGTGNLALQQDDGIEMVWHQISGANAEIFGIHIGNDNLPDSGQLQLNTYTTNDQTHPRVAAAGNGSFLVVWQSLGAPAGDTDSSGWSIRGRQLDATGEPVGASFQVNEVTTGDQTSPVVAPTPDGTSFMVAWQSESSDGGDTSSWSIRARLYSAALPLFADGFESGDTTAWDAVAP